MVFYARVARTTVEWHRIKTGFAPLKNFAKHPNEAFFSVCDGHGKDGHLCAAYASDRVPRSVFITHSNSFMTVC
jgi:Serine/threonine protein phosphatase